MDHVALEWMSQCIYHTAGVTGVLQVFRGRGKANTGIEAMQTHYSVVSMDFLEDWSEQLSLVGKGTKSTKASTVSKFSLHLHCVPDGHVNSNHAEY